MATAPSNPATISRGMPDGTHHVPSASSVRVVWCAATPRHRTVCRQRHELTGNVAGPGDLTGRMGRERHGSTGEGPGSGRSEPQTHGSTGAALQNERSPVSSNL
jgi:hypothetical protein